MLFLKASIFFSYFHVSSFFNLPAVLISLAQVDVQLYKVSCVYTVGACECLITRVAHVIMDRREE